MTPPGARSRPAVAVPVGAVLFHQGRALVYVRVKAGRLRAPRGAAAGPRGNDSWIFARARAPSPRAWSPARSSSSAEPRCSSPRSSAATWTPIENESDGHGPRDPVSRVIPRGQCSSARPESCHAPSHRPLVDPQPGGRRRPLGAACWPSASTRSSHAKLDVFPEFVPPQVVVQTEAPGLAADEVEPLVTLPIEQALLGIPGLDVLRSQSIQGLSVSTLIFQDGTDIYRARQLVAERLTEVAGQLPDGVKPPRLGPLTSSTGRLLVIGFTSEKLSPLELRDWAQWTLQAAAAGGSRRGPGHALRRGRSRVPGAGRPGRPDRPRPDPDRHPGRHPAGHRRPGRRLPGERNQRSIVRVEAQVRSAAELGEAVVTTSGGNAGAAPGRGAAWSRPRSRSSATRPSTGEPGVTLDIFKQYGGDTLETTRRVEAELERLRPGLERPGDRLPPGPVPPGRLHRAAPSATSRMRCSWARSWSRSCCSSSCSTCARR